MQQLSGQLWSSVYVILHSQDKKPVQLSSQPLWFEEQLSRGNDVISTLAEIRFESPAIHQLT